MVVPRYNKEREEFVIESWKWFQADLPNVLDFIFDITRWYPIIEKQ